MVGAVARCTSSHSGRRTPTARWSCGKAHDGGHRIGRSAVSSNAPQRLSPLDVMFLYGERPDTMMHVASLMPFQSPADASPAFLRELVDQARRNPEVRVPGPHLGRVSEDRSVR